MDNATYRKNVLKTLSQKPAKLGLKWVARDQRRTNIFHAISGLMAETAELVTGLSPYIVGASRYVPAMKLNAMEEGGDICYFISVASKFLKVKQPASTKKAKLKSGTRSEALMQLLHLSTLMFDQVKKNFYGPVMKAATKKDYKVTFPDAANPDKAVKEYFDVAVSVIDVEATKAKYEEREALMAGLLAQYIELFGQVVYDLFEEPVANLYVSNIAKLSERYEHGFFELSETEPSDEDREAEMAAVTAADPTALVV